MSNIDKQWLQQKIAEMEDHRDLFPGDLDDDHASVLSAFRIALASLEAEPVAYMYKDNLHADARFSLHTRFGNWSQEDINEYEITEIPLYTAPPAPVSVPDAIHSQGEKSASDDYYALGWNACRAAMLQGADGNAPAHFRSRPAQSSLSPAQGGNSPVIPDGWVDCSERMPREVLAALQNIARLRRNLNDFCGDKSVIAKCLIEAEEALLNAVNRHSTMLAAAPQQEAKNV
ncbi:hypothetical protein ACTLKO_001595 [Enterobacter ludwigii]|uniref:hypothetical protein n=1 Tax=Enterobacter ludwigii TaxID=299767 RepID=UPI0035C78143